jgi:hypothetical protein
MVEPSIAPPPVFRILRRIGDPFEAESLESAPAAVEPAHVALLNRLFYESAVDLGALVRVQDITYVCTRSGWRTVPTGPGR